MSIARIVALTAMLAACFAARAETVPQLGRFLQRDPNASGQVVLDDSTWFRGRGPNIVAPSLDVLAMYGNGLNLHEYLGSSPVVRSDPLGLSWDPFEMVDEIAFEHQLSGVIALAKIDAFFEDKEVLRKIRAYEQGAFGWTDLVWDRDVGTLFSMVGGAFFSRVCFVEGTLIATPSGQEPIECLVLGQSVTSRQDPEHIVEDGRELSRDADALSLVRMRYRHSDGSITTMELLRPTRLMTSLHLTPGSELPVSLPEMGLNGLAEVLSIEAFCETVRLDIPVVTGRLVTDSAEVVNVHLEGHELPIGVTPQHPLYSADRNCWIASGDAIPGERLQAEKGIAVVNRVEYCQSRDTVYNVEVSRYHTYFVGEAGVWAHNPCFPTSGSRNDQTTWVTRTIESMRNAGGASPRAIYDFVAATLREANLSKQAYLELLEHAKSILGL